MNSVNITSVDPRDTTWEDEHVVYRVYFTSADHRRTDEYELTDAVNINEVLTWAALEGSKRGHFVVYARVERAGERGLLRLASSGEQER